MIFSQTQGNKLMGRSVFSGWSLSIRSLLSSKLPNQIYNFSGYFCGAEIRAEQQPAAICGLLLAALMTGLDVEVKIKLVRVGPQFDVVDFVFGLVINPHVDDILGENIAFKEKFLIGL